MSRPEEREEHGELNRGRKRMRRRKRGKSSVQESGGLHRDVLKLSPAAPARPRVSLQTDDKD